MKKIILDGRNFSSSETLHPYIKKMLDLPDYYGNNLDALMDCLTEMDEADITIINTDPSDPYVAKVLKVFFGAGQEGAIKVHIE